MQPLPKLNVVMPPTEGARKVGKLVLETGWLVVGDSFEEKERTTLRLPPGTYTVFLDYGDFPVPFGKRTTRVLLLLDTVPAASGNWRNVVPPGYPVQRYSTGGGISLFDADTSDMVFMTYPAVRDGSFPARTIVWDQPDTWTVIGAEVFLFDPDEYPI